MDRRRGQRRYTGTFPAEPRGVGAVRGEMVAVAQSCGLSEDEVAAVRLAVSEAATNAVIHGHSDRVGRITVSAYVGDGELLIVIADDGPGMMPRPDSPGLGLGLPLIASVCKSMEVVAGKEGTEVHMTFPCPRERTPSA